MIVEILFRAFWSCNSLARNVTCSVLGLCFFVGEQWVVGRLVLFVRERWDVHRLVLFGREQCGVGRLVGRLELFGRMAISYYSVEWDICDSLEMDISCALLRRGSV